MTQTRVYSCKDTDMLMASKVIATSLTNQLADLSMVRSNWTPEYAQALHTKIDNAMEDFLGLDKKKALRDATAALTEIQAPAFRALQFLKTQIEVDFGNDAKEIVKTLGYDKYLKAARANDQEALIQLLFAFKKGMTNQLKDDIVAKGTNPALIDSIIGYATQLSEANLTQETLKSTTKVVSETALNAFNDIYNEIIGICKIASSYYLHDEILKAQFTFSRVIANMNAAGKKAETPEESVE
ncbi:hypothetical protein OU798_20925 [Prolixibacteraceae bacterium Z1-6]|uniref:Uncharacterized protein n=1 Tax=Draconibacterium aestuarii TaxID=2998507 RepID=A0A9X3F936_9BACT|nr:hypothetical protein [Prolixibacteraceae bacterium Z1-6]